MGGDSSVVTTPSSIARDVVARLSLSYLTNNLTIKKIDCFIIFEEITCRFPKYRRMIPDIPFLKGISGKFPQIDFHFRTSHGEKFDCITFSI
jgi:hypothetical protein